MRTSIWVPQEHWLIEAGRALCVCDGFAETPLKAVAIGIVCDYT